MLLALALLDWSPPETLCRIADKRITESSGLAASRTQDGVFYTHNDSGDGPRVFRFDREGNVTGVFELPGVVARDWEDMASATLRQKPFLFVGDIGDNARAREWVTVYRFPEPTGPGGQVPSREAYRLTYPDGAHDCEALLVDPKTGDVVLVTKERTGPTFVFRFRPAGGGEYTLSRVCTLVVDTGGLGGRLVTGGDFAPDGRSVVLRTYSAALEFDVPDDRAWWKSVPRTIVTAPETQGEAVCFSRDGSHLLTTSEGSPCPVSIMKRL
jgi:hypothetical protein